MRIVEFYCENLLCLKAVPITPDGRIVEITGKNGSGKSSVLNAIFFALAGTKGVGTKPVRKGTQRAIVRLKIQDALRDIIVTRRFTVAGGTTLTVETSDGAVFRSPQALLDGLIEGLSFDPLAFSRQPAKAQVDTLRAIVKLDTDVDKLDAANARDYEQRTAVNRTVASAKQRLATLNESVNDALDVTLEDVSALTQQMAEASQVNAALEREATARVRKSETRVRLLDEARHAREQAASLIAGAEKLEAEASALLNDLTNAEDMPAAVDVTALKQQIDAAMKENAVKEQQIRARTLRDTAKQELEAATVLSKGLSDAIDRRTQEKQDAIGRAKMPIAGLSFGDGEVIYNGVPYSQASTAEQIRVATAIGIALNPELRIICIRDGSLLDDDSRAIVAQLAEEHDFQVWIEKVQATSGVGFHMVDGRVAAINGEEVTEPAGEELAVAGD